MQKIHILDYGMGNLQSVQNGLKKLGLDASISSNCDDIKNAHKLIFPGVGHFGKAMQNLKQLDLLEVLHEIVLIKKIPVLGICLGMQLMAKSSEEGDVDGLGWFDASVKKIEIRDNIKYKIPHTGWNTIQIQKESELMKGIPDEGEFYFVHAYHVQCANISDVLNTTVYDQPFVSAIEKDNIFGVQYHPEKSHAIGKKLINNFIKL
jgi:glutamine amidotransferase